MALIGRLRDFRVGGFAFEWHGFCNSFASAPKDWQRDRYG
jgi:hypothetical protein